MEAFIKSDKIVPVGSYITEEDKAAYKKIMANNFSPAMNWYRAAIQDLNSADEKTSGPGGSPVDPFVHLPVLMIATSRDPVSGGPRAVEGMRQLMKGEFKAETLDSGHWVQLEKMDEVNKILDGWFAEREAKVAKAEL